MCAVCLLAAQDGAAITTFTLPCLLEALGWAHTLQRVVSCSVPQAFPVTLDKVIAGDCEVGPGSCENGTCHYAYKDCASPTHCTMCM